MFDAERRINVHILFKADKCRLNLCRYTSTAIFLPNANSIVKYVSEHTPAGVSHMLRHNRFHTLK